MYVYIFFYTHSLPTVRQLPSDTSYTSLPTPRTTSVTTPTSPIPSININGHAYTPEEEEDDVFQQKELRYHFNKRSSLRHHNSVYTNNHNNNRISQVVNGLRNAHSTSQLNAGVNVDNTVSMSDLSISTEAKKKKKKPIKAVLKRVFSRSSPKLQQTAE